MCLLASEICCVLVLCSELSQLKQCQGAVLRRHCGSAAADVLNRLFDIALRDPHYLRFGYQPDCRLHGAESVPAQPQSPTVARGGTPEVSYSSPDSRNPLPRSRGHDRAPPRTDDRNERVQQAEDRSAASKHQRASLVVFPVALLLTAAAVHLR